MIKVEAPEGDDTRRWGPPFIEREGESRPPISTPPTGANASVTCDFRTAEGQETVRRLVADADVVIENFKVGGLAKYGLDWDSLRKVNPRLIYCSITGFGQDGPYAHRAGYDFIIQGMSGLMSVTGDAGWPAAKGRRGGDRHLHRRLCGDGDSCGAGAARADRARASRSTWR